MAKDVAQESWITVISKLHTLKNVESFKSWAFRIVYSKSIDAINRRKYEVDKLPSDIFNDADSNSSHNNDPNIYKSLLSAIKKLPKEKQDIIRLFYTEEYSISEISEFLKVPTGTVKSRLFKAREKLKSFLKK